jgi:hypothetical protein
MAASKEADARAQFPRYNVFLYFKPAGEIVVRSMLFLACANPVMSENERRLHAISKAIHAYDQTWAGDCPIEKVEVFRLGVEESASNDVRAVAGDPGDGGAVCEGDPGSARADEL